MRIDQIRTDGGTQPRAELQPEVIQDYAEFMTSGIKFPSVTVFYDGSTYWLADGFHRVAAAKVARLTEIDADVRQGSLDDAKWYSYSVNQSHGLRRTNADKRRAVEAALAHPYSKDKSAYEIARHCGVSDEMVRKSPIYQKLVDSSTRTVTRNGSTYPMNTDNIGHKMATRDDPDEIELIPDEPKPEREPLVLTMQANNGNGKKATFNRTNDNIEWAWWSWNPVTGCKHSCSYCYARAIAMRFTGHFEPEYHPERLEAPFNTKVPVLPEDALHVDKVGSTNVFVCSMADLFGAWVPQEWIDAVMDTVRQSPQWNYIFLSKNPKRMAEINWPVNAWVGTTVDCQARVKPAEAAFAKINAAVKFVSCEPLTEAVTFNNIKLFDWVIIGGYGESTPGNPQQPEYAWVKSLMLQAWNAGLFVYGKTNKDFRPREYPA